MCEQLDRRLIGLALKQVAHVGSEPCLIVQVSEQLAMLGENVVADLVPKHEPGNLELLRHRRDETETFSEWLRNEVHKFVRPFDPLHSNDGQGACDPA